MLNVIIKPHNDIRIRINGLVNRQQASCYFFFLPGRQRLPNLATSIAGLRAFHLKEHLPAVHLEVSAVVKPIPTLDRGRLGGGDGCTGGPGHLLALGHMQLLADAAHVHPALQPDEALLAPARAPAKAEIYELCSWSGVGSTC